MITRLIRDVRLWQALAAILLIALAAREYASQTAPVTPTPTATVVYVAVTPTAPPYPGPVSAPVIPIPSPTSTPLSKKPQRRGSLPPELEEPILPIEPSATAKPPTSESLPTLVPPVYPGRAEQLPRIQHDLLFVSQNNLMRWNHQTGHIELLATAVNWYMSSGNGQQVMFSRAAMSDQQELLTLNLRTLRLVMIARVPAIKSDFWQHATNFFAVAPDGRSVAYLQRGARPADPRIPTPIPTPTSHPSGNGYKASDYDLIAGMIYTSPSGAIATATEVGYCASRVADDNLFGIGCIGLLWSPDGRSLVWGDWYGLWQAEIGQAARLLAANSLESSTGLRVWEPRAWSPSRRYLLAFVSEYEGGELGIVDTQSGRTVIVPNTISPGELPAIWLRDERLLVANGVGSIRGPETAADIWRIHSQPNLTLVHDLAIPSGHAGLIRVLAPTQLSDGQLLIALSNDSLTDYQGRGLYAIDLDQGRLRKLTGMPPRPVSQVDANPEVIWSPDGVAAIIHNISATGRVLDTQGQWRIFSSTIFAPTDGKPQTDLAPVIGDDVCCFSWTP